MNNTPSFEQNKNLDATLPGFPGEHWLVLGAGVTAWWLTRNSSSSVVRAGGLVVGTALVGRAASGRNGLAKLLQFLPVGRGLR